MKRFFTILGGMGTEATESYIHLLNLRTPAHSDQDYLNYILVNHATIPDRTSYIMDHSKPNPLPALLDDVRQQNLLHPEFYALPCNTAHYFYKQISDAANAPVLHMPKEAVAEISKRYPNAKRVGLIATQGTLADHIYDADIKNHGYQLVLPDKHVEAETMHLIYHDVKANNDADPKLYHHILAEMVNQFHCDVIILGCTELSLAQERAGNHRYPVIDAQAVLVDHSIQLAEKDQKNK
ncbi:aspartate/glutamate racemase family protein [Acetilactobacillus jinshanensis]|uniref:Amino acid racemase n=1 Tax=Acetilactobacillus jinshanensis TaxID=1720083 RepID=A0A4P6ZMN9_9LACO|nr:amino acid racemase [Acetilactobacillus jinshanensis]QBP18702.1 amino acid racemase [Acetilactobacillus jinshanensis]URL61577.1 amino acid racemase [uncultured bacterium]